MATIPLVVIEDSTIARMVQDPAFSSFPCLAGKSESVMPKATGCGSCAKAAATKQKEALRQIKACLAHIGPEDRAKLKTLLNADKIKVISISATGQVLTTSY
jgi:hypothetical protein